MGTCRTAVLRIQCHKALNKPTHQRSGGHYALNVTKQHVELALGAKPSGPRVGIKRWLRACPVVAARACGAQRCRATGNVAVADVAMGVAL